MTDETLYRVVYASSGIREFSDVEIEDILATSRRNNQRDDLTGMLLYSGGNFLQVLEGPRTALENAMSRINADPRHHGIIVFQKKSITVRGFEDWTMGFRYLASGDMAQIDGYNPFMESSFDNAPFERDPDFAYRMLVQFKEKMR